MIPRIQHLLSLGLLSAFLSMGCSVREGVVMEESTAHFDVTYREVPGIFGTTNCTTEIWFSQKTCAGLHEMWEARGLDTGWLMEDLDQLLDGDMAAAIMPDTCPLGEDGFRPKELYRAILQGVASSDLELALYQFGIDDDRIFGMSGRKHWSRDAELVGVETYLLRRSAGEGPLESEGRDLYADYLALLATGGSQPARGEVASNEGASL